jgi:nucleotide-binding universal stress UspA family protein
VAGWYDEVYLPVVEALRQRDLLAEFPGRTEADLYLWISRHRAALREALEWEVEPGDAAADLAYQTSPRVQRVASRLASRVLDAITPDELEAGPSPGNWRREHLVTGREDRLFTDILVPVSGYEVGWRALQQALEVARREGGRLFGLYVVPDEDQHDSEKAQAVQAEFERRCEEGGIRGQLAIATGKVARTICERARWTHLIALSLLHPPQPQPGAKLQSGFRTLIRRCSPPMLAVPGVVSPLERALLAYDGSPKAQEALFVATYLAGQWRIPLIVVSTDDHERVTSARLSEAEDYLQGHGVQATFVARRGPPAEAILHTAEERSCDLVLLGGYGRAPLAEVILGSTVDELLRTSPWPMLICR